MEHHRGVVILLSFAAVLAALLGARASVLSADASTAWQEGTRAKVKEAAAFVESIRYIYGVEVPRAVNVTEIRFRHEEFSSIPNVQRLSPSVRRDIAVETGVQKSLLEAVEQGSTLAADPRYRTPAGFDPVEMLIDERENFPELLAVDPHHEKEIGDEKSDEAIALVATTIPVSIAFLCGSLARGFPRRRRTWLIVGFVFLGLAVAFAIFGLVA